MEKILFLDTTHPILPEQLTRDGYGCDYHTTISRKDCKEVIGQYSGIIIRGRIRLDKEMLERAGRLRFIGRAGAGMEGIDTAFAESRGIHCLNAPEGNRDALAEHSCGMLLCLLNHLIRADREIRLGLWKRETNRGVELKGKTLAIIGYGNMGSAFASRLRGFDMEILAYDKYKQGFGDACVKETNMEEIFARADFLSLNVPLTEETAYLVDARYLENFKKNIILINTSRGKVVDTAALAAGLQSGKVLGAALDVIEYEGLSFENLDETLLPDAFRTLCQSDKIILSPHIAGWTLESHRKLALVLLEKIRQLK
ncbi:MAG TPA: NAD(P)-dependent oxidoreductase [Bacteroidales bacterium]|nr:NAD(P)-dependent oxidoreductase [Bacteroidales bacterium]HSA42552.1 NAD(P)-dependent oxidoreductase [Bacteroidales bacterium]